MSTDPLVVPARFCGPPTSGNGGWTAGALAAYVDAPAVRVSLRRPPPLDTPMPVTVEGSEVSATHDGVVVVTAAPADPSVPVDPVDVATARAARPPTGVDHAFPTCFVCGPDRAEGDGLRIFPGPVDGDPDGAWAATWTPYAAHADVPTTWAAVDCPGGWAAGFGGDPMVLAAITARVAALPVPGEEHVVVGELRRRDGRKRWTAASLYAPDGALVASAEHLWVTLPPS